MNEVISKFNAILPEWYKISVEKPEPIGYYSDMEVHIILTGPNEFHRFAEGRKGSHIFDIRQGDPVEAVKDLYVQAMYEIADQSGNEILNEYWRS